MVNKPLVADADILWEQEIDATRERRRRRGKNESVDVFVQKDVIDQDSVPIIYTETQVAEFQPL